MTAFKKMEQKELNELIKKHDMFMNGRPGGARAVIRDRDLSGLSFEKAKLSQSDFTGCIMRGCDLSGAQFESATLFGCDMTKAKLYHTNFTRADLRGADITGADLREAVLDGADLREGASVLRVSADEEGRDIYKEQQKGNVVLVGSDLSGASLQNTHATKADFGNANLSGADLSGAQLQSANLEGSDMTGSNMSKTDLRSANLKDSIMLGVDLEQADIKDADLAGALTDDQSGRAYEEVALTLDEMVKKHTEWVSSAGRQGKQLNLSDYDMRNIRTLAGARLTAIKAMKTMFAGVNFTGTEMQSAILDGSDFRKCDMRSIDLRASSLKGALLNRADMRNANLSFLSFTQKDGNERHTPCNLEGAWLRYTDLSGAQLRGAILRNADLSHADLTDCDLRGTDFRGADLTQTIFEHAQTDGALFDAGSPQAKR